MYKKQRSLTDEILFNYYMISSVQEDEIYSPFPFYADHQVFHKMVHATCVLNRLVKRVIQRIIEDPQGYLFEMDEFPARKEVLSKGLDLYPFFWVRYDAFQRENGGIFFSEFNYDKPCAQRETAVNDLFGPFNNPSKDFKEKFRDGFEKLWKKFNYDGRKPVVAVLVDPAHYEEQHLAHLFIDLLKELDYEIIIAGGKNFKVQGDKVFAFNREIDVILRQFPTEFLHEVEDYSEILRLFAAGKILIINDPRAVIGQAKSIFADLWRMVEEKDPFLSEEEITVIKETVPYTALFGAGVLDDLYSHKDQYVIKAVFGRFSEEVYIGKMHTEEEWHETIKYVLSSEKKHIVQEFCPIRKEAVLRFYAGSFREVEAFANFGIYLTNEDFAGVSIRWSEDYLSVDDTVWISPVGLREKSFQVVSPAHNPREEMWQEINDKAAFLHGYTGGYTGLQESFTLQGLVLDKNTVKEIKSATESIGRIIKKTTEFVQDHCNIFSPVLGISDTLIDVVNLKHTDCLTFIGRMDWVIDSKGDLKLLEFNSETPAGLMEALVLNEMVREKLGWDYLNPNQQMGTQISDTFMNILSQYSKVKEIRNIGIVSSAYNEDWYNTTILYEQIRHLPFHFVLGEVSGLVAKEGRLYLYGTPLDAIYRYYPLDWLEEDPYYKEVAETFKGGTLSINPPSTLISQSKAFFALVFELMKQGYYNEFECGQIVKYIPETALDFRQLRTDDYCAKPLFGREGQDIFFNFAVDVKKMHMENFVYQERIDVQTIPLDVFTVGGSRREVAFPVIGAYVAGDSFAGIYTRAGSRVTNKWAVFLPTYTGE